MPGTNRVLQFLARSEGFDKVIRKIKILSAAGGSCLAELKIENEHTNPTGELHAGFSALLVDNVSTCGLFTHQNGNCLHVSVNIEVSYLKRASIGDEIIIDAKTLQAGKHLAFLTVEIKNKSTGDTLVRGSHTKYLMVDHGKVFD